MQEVWFLIFVDAELFGTVDGHRTKGEGIRSACHYTHLGRL